MNHLALTNRLMLLREEIARIASLNRNHYPIKRHTLPDIKSHDKRRQRLQEIREELGSLRVVPLNPHV